MKPVKVLVDLVVLALTQTTDGGRWFRLGPLPSSRSGSTSFMGVIGTFPAFVIASADSTCFMRGDLQLIRRESVQRPLRGLNPKSGCPFVAVRLSWSADAVPVPRTYRR